MSTTREFHAHQPRRLSTLRRATDDPNYTPPMPRRGLPPIAAATPAATPAPPGDSDVTIRGDVLGADGTAATAARGLTVGDLRDYVEALSSQGAAADRPLVGTVDGGGRLIRVALAAEPLPAGDGEDATAGSTLVLDADETPDPAAVLRASLTRRDGSRVRVTGI